MLKLFYIFILIFNCKANLLIVIPIFNRPGYVCLVLKNLVTNPCLNCTFILLEDSDSTIGKTQLLQWSAPHFQYLQMTKPESFLKRKNIANFMAQKAHYLFNDMTDADHLLLLDSDMLPCPDWNAKLLKALTELGPKFRGVLTLYRSGAKWHKSLYCGNFLCQQSSIGNAGTVWSRQLSFYLLTRKLNINNWDMEWTELFNKKKIPQMALKESALLHMGMYGSNGVDSQKEKAIGFPVNYNSSDAFLNGLSPENIHFCIFV
jgi:hypothetical protein